MTATTTVEIAVKARNLAERLTLIGTKLSAAERAVVEEAAAFFEEVRAYFSEASPAITLSDPVKTVSKLEAQIGGLGEASATISRLLADDNMPKRLKTALQLLDEAIGKAMAVASEAKTAGRDESLVIGKMRGDMLGARSRMMIIQEYAEARPYLSQLDSIAQAIGMK